MTKTKHITMKTLKQLTAIAAEAEKKQASDFSNGEWTPNTPEVKAQLAELCGDTFKMSLSEFAAFQKAEKKRIAAERYAKNNVPSSLK